MGMPFESPFGLGDTLTDPPSLFGEIARMIKTISLESILFGGWKKI
jgi:hypothetical protein